MTTLNESNEQKEQFLDYQNKKREEILGKPEKSKPTRYPSVGVGLILSILFTIVLISLIAVDNDSVITSVSAACIPQPVLQPCLGYVVIHMPNVSYTPNDTWYLDFEMNDWEICYDVHTDPDNLRSQVAELFEKHPNYWMNHLDEVFAPSAIDTIIFVKENHSITEAFMERIYNLSVTRIKCGDSTYMVD